MKLEYNDHFSFLKSSGVVFGENRFTPHTEFFLVLSDRISYILFAMTFLSANGSL